MSCLELCHLIDSLRCRLGPSVALIAFAQVWYASTAGTTTSPSSQLWPPDTHRSFRHGWDEPGSALRQPKDGIACWTWRWGTITNGQTALATVPPTRLLCLGGIASISIIPCMANALRRNARLGMELCFEITLKRTPIILGLVEANCYRRFLSQTTNGPPSISIPCLPDTTPMLVSSRLRHPVTGPPGTPCSPSASHPEGGSAGTLCEATGTQEYAAPYLGLGLVTLPRAWGNCQKHVTAVPTLRPHLISYL